MTQIVILMKTFSFLFFKGIAMTLMIWATSLCISCLIGIPLGIFSSNRVGKKATMRYIKLYVFLVRAVPVYVQVLIVYFVIPELLPITLSPVVAASCALGICSSGYMAEIVRSGINAVGQGQWDAAFVLGYSYFQTIYYVVMPQALRCIMPTFFNELESLVKSTSIVSVIGVFELTKVGSTLVARTMQPIPIYLFLAVAYCGISLLLYMVRVFCERKFPYVKN